MNKLLLSLLLVALLSSCDVLSLFDGHLSLEKEPFSVSQLRVDGVYYTELENYEGTYYRFYILYRNGVILYLGGSNNFDFFKEQFSENSFQQKHNWGVFVVRQDSITFERWDIGEISPCQVRSGTISNDSTFTIKEIYQLKNGKKRNWEKENATYHFIQHNPKPDSTNRFIP